MLALLHFQFPFSKLVSVSCRQSDADPKPCLPSAVVAECILTILDFIFSGLLRTFFYSFFSSCERRFRRKKRRAVVQSVLVLTEHSIAVPYSIDSLYFIV